MLASHHAAHMGWHQEQWDKEASAAAPAAAFLDAVPRRTVDVWCNKIIRVEAGSVLPVRMISPASGARCVAVLAYPPLDLLAVECWGEGGPVP